MLGNRYCLHEPILSVHTPREGQKECLYVPAGEVIAIASRDPLNSKFVEVHWDSKTVKMFWQDITERAEMVNAFAVG
jgi:hypothetical protein